MHTQRFSLNQMHQLMNTNQTLENRAPRQSHNVIKNMCGTIHVDTKTPDEDFHTINCSN